jgi:hypothetical protein
MAEELDAKTKRKLNSGFAKRIEEQGGSPVDALIEVKAGEVDETIQALGGLATIDPDGTGVIGNTFIPATIDTQDLPEITSIPTVKRVHQDQKVGVKAGDVGGLDFPTLAPGKDPVRTVISDAVYEMYGARDKYVGNVGISRVEAPRLNFAQLPPGDPVQTAFSAVEQLSPQADSGDKYIPTGRSVEFVRDASLTDGELSDDTAVAILDTGLTPLEPSNGGRVPRLESLVPGEGPQDMHGHGSWCSFTAAGYEAPSTWGTVNGVASGAKYGHFKCLNTFPGFGKTSWILKAMERALKWGADVISMSLGGEQQGDVDEDPYCIFIEENCKENAGDEDGAIFVTAVSNSGPDKWQVGSPGVAPKAITVGAWSLVDDAPAVFSSRGPQGGWYEDNDEAFKRDLKEKGATEFVKPDLVSPGGGRENDTKAQNANEYLHQTEVGWVEGVFDGLKDARGLMQGSSMATPHAAGLVARLYDRGIIKTAKEVKRVAREEGSVPEFETAAANANEQVNGKNVAVGYGVLRESLFAPDG